MKLLTDGSEKSPILSFCLAIIAKYGEKWPLSEQTLSSEFVHWLGYHYFIVTRSGLEQLCEAKGVRLSFSKLPPEIRGFNCSFGNYKEIVITEPESAPFADSHTLFHEFREMLEHVFIDLGKPIVRSKASLEERAESFAIRCRMEGVIKDVPTMFEMIENVEKKWARYLAYAFCMIFSMAYMLGCVFTPQMEEVHAEARSQRYVRT